MNSGFPQSYLSATTSSFTEFARGSEPAVLPRLEAAGTGGTAPGVAHGTTIVALRTGSGVLMAGDRRATMGNLIASRTIEKVHAADPSSVIGIAGTAGLSLELIRLFQVELEHYEKIEGTSLSLSGKANRLAAMLRSNLGLAMSGLAVVPLFAGVEPGTEDGRIYSFDVTGGKYAELDYHSIGSGSGFARGALKKLWTPGADEETSIRVAVESLIDASDDDSATGGPDFVRAIAPLVLVVDSHGVRRIPEETVLEVASGIVGHRTGAGSTTPGGRP